jgi:phage protein D
VADTKETESILPDYEVYINGGKLPPEAHVDINSIEVDQDIETVDMFSILMNPGEYEMEKRFKWIDSELLSLGSEIKIKAGYETALRTLLVGETTSLSPDYSDSGSITLTVQGYDRLYRLGYGRKIRSFRKMKDSDIVAQVARDWKLTPETEATDVVHEYVFQNNKTDREFLIERARLNGFELRVENKTLYFRKPKEDRSKIITLTYGEKLIDFFPRLTALRQTSKVTVKGWNPQNKKGISGEAGIGDEASKMAGKQTGGEIVKNNAGQTEWTICMGNVAAKGEADAIAAARFREMADDLIIGEGSCIGNPAIKAGTVIELKGLGERFSGLYYLVSCRHTIGEKGYTVYFNVKRSAV